MADSCHPPIGLYVHVLCVKRCTYCDFATWTGREKEIPRHVDAVVEEIDGGGARKRSIRGRIQFFLAAAPRRC